MAQRDVVKLVAAVALGLAVGALIALAGRNFRGDTETDVTLSAINGACTLGKATHVRVRQTKHLIWEIENYCTEGAKTVVVGNFRTAAGPSSANDCSDAGPDYPFTDTSLQRRTANLQAATLKGNGRVDSEDGRISLKAKGKGELGDSERTYHFDICLDGRKTDPTVLVERE